MDIYDISSVYDLLDLKLCKKNHTISSLSYFKMGEYISKKNKLIGFKIYFKELYHGRNIYGIKSVKIIFEGKDIKTQVYDFKGRKVECNYFGHLLCETFDDINLLIENLEYLSNNVHITGFCFECKKKDLNEIDRINFINKSIEESEFKEHYSKSIINDIYDKTIAVNTCLKCIESINKDYDNKKKSLYERFLTILKNKSLDNNKCLEEIFKAIRTS